MDFLQPFFSTLVNKGSVRFSVHVHARAKKSAVIAVRADGVLKCSVHSVPEDGKATNELLDMLSVVFKVPRNCVRCITGHFHSKKLIEIQRGD